jgi:hypothetical protein
MMPSGINGGLCFANPPYELSVANKTKNLIVAGREQARGIPRISVTVLDCTP